MRLRLRFLLLSGGLALLGGCVDRYTPDVAPADRSSLVVDGFINAQGSSVIKLARSFSVNTKSTPVEAKAQVTIQDDAGRRYGLAENPAGTYTSAANALDPSRRYQLRITTSLGRQYASDPEPVVLTPPIDSLSGRSDGLGGVQLYVSTHAAATAARYYRWDYDETWQFTAAYKSELEYVASSNTIQLRPSEHQIFTCWRTESSTDIRQGNTTQLAQNALVAYPLLLLAPTSKIHYGYSILVRQVAEDQAEYTYWETLRKNTEALGTVNDPLPGRVTGNVHALADASEVVLGYVGVHTVTEKRLFVDAATLGGPRPNAIFIDLFYANCTYVDRALPPAMLNLCQLGIGIPLTTFPTAAMYDNTVPVTFYYYSSPDCVDCRLRGTNVKPIFWP
ncbi:DUF4249 domain-containing protein [Hymenobacter sp. RP-2-7]|uniref:DUF4249 domain-containing protein n=1 Tax=Hymenobacter polaris TaxID=2682546 RepID=A0A7Y0ADI7_9BACT|nr:DUF4249 domain-containing protein [Hymenobacter polaris]NML65301.1 DUF4249 domain-containing protein [Hymenobacter polaris]